MKLKEDYVLQHVAGSWVVVPMGKAAVDFGGMLTLNETGVTLWKALETGGEVADLARALTAEYDVSMELAEKDAAAFVQKLRAVGCLEED